MFCQTLIKYLPLRKGLSIPFCCTGGWLSQGYASKPLGANVLSLALSSNTLSWNLWSLHFPDDWLNSQLCLPVSTAKTTAADFLRKLNGNQAKYGRQ